MASSHRGLIRLAGRRNAHRLLRQLRFAKNSHATDIAPPLQLVRVQPDRERPVVDQLDVHHRPEHAAANVLLAQVVLD